MPVEDSEVREVLPEKALSEKALCRRNILKGLLTLSVSILVALFIAGIFAPRSDAAATSSIVSTTDTQIVQNRSSQNYGSATILGADGDVGSGNDQSALIKWDLSSIAPGTKVSSATVTLTVTDLSPQTYEVYRLKRAWVESTATWNVYASGKRWEKAGAKGPLDRGAAVVGTITPSATGSQTFTLSSAAVQSWVDNPASNQGIIIADAANRDGFKFYSGESGTISQRPQLSVTTTSGDDPVGEPPVNPTPAGFVARNGPNFELDGAPFRFVGANMYNAAGDPNIYECGPYMQTPDEELDDWFGRFKRDSGGRVIRFWAYQSYTKGGTDWRALDRVMRLANKHGLKVIPVLENQWVECSEGGYKYDTWYSGGYLKPYGGYPLSYKEYVQRVVERYKNEPAVAAWMLMNEAESKTNTGAENAEALYTFTRDMSAFVKSLDQNHLVTLGSMGTGQPGVSGSNYQRLYSLPALDFMEFHDYNANDEAMPGAPAKAPLNTTIFTQDYGWNWRDVGYRQDKARAWETFSAKLPEITVPTGEQPFKRIGINVYGDLVGDVYIDEVRIGSRVYGFEDGTTQGFQSSSNVQLSNASSTAYAGSRSLKLAVSKPGGEQVWVPATSADVPGTEITVLMYVDTDACGTDTLVAAMCTSKELNKPILVGEAGMTACGSYNGSQPETPKSRATKFDAKIGAFFKEGGAGYLIWAWDPKSSCSTDFTSGDPLNAILAKYAANP
jgi:hypothetical protein